jgi:transposase
MLHAGLDLSRNRLEVCLLCGHCEVLAQFAAPSDADGLRGLARRVGGYGLPVRAVIESMTGARFVHDTLEQFGWDVLIADAQKVKGLAPLTCKTDRIDARVLAVLSHVTWCRRSGCPIRESAPSASRRAFGCIWSSTARCSGTASTRR